MKAKLPLIFFLFLGMQCTFGQVFSTSYGPKVYINPSTIKEKKIQSLTFTEYMIEGKNKDRLDKFDILFDTAGMPSNRVLYLGKKWNKRDTISLEFKTSYDTIAYDKNKNIVYVKLKNVFEKFYKYDSLNNEIYFLYLGEGDRTGHDFGVTIKKYDKKSRLISESSKGGHNWERDTTKITYYTLITYLYDDEKLLNVKDKKIKYDDTGHETSNYTTEFFYEYKNSVLERIYTPLVSGIFETLIMRPLEK